jgi:N-terminal acetyltransferase B complex catalytic subunit
MMATVRPMRADDLFKFNTCNLDHLTETYHTGFYLEYLAKWPHLCRVIEGHDGKIEGYSMCITASISIITDMISQF